MTQFGQAKPFGQRVAGGQQQGRKPAAKRRFLADSAPQQAADTDLSPEAEAFRQKMAGQDATAAAIDGGFSARDGAGVRAGKPVWFLRVPAFLVDIILVGIVAFFLGGEAMINEIDAMTAASEGLGLDAAAIETKETVIQLKYVFFFFLLQAIYFTAMEISPLQASLGKMLCGIAVTDNEGGKPGVGAILRRNFIGKTLSNITPAYFGYMLGIFTKNKKCLHDYVGGTQVRRRC